MKKRARVWLPGDEKADQGVWRWNDLPLPLVVLMATLLVGLVILAGPLLALVTATIPVTQTIPTARVMVPSVRPAPTPTPVPSPTPLPTALPEGYHVLAADVENASFGLPAWPEPVELDEDTYRRRGT